MELLADIPRHGMPARVVELMACDAGCVGGPGMDSELPVFVAFKESAPTPRRLCQGVISGRSNTAMSI